MVGARAIEKLSDQVEHFTILQTALILILDKLLQNQFTVHHHSTIFAIYCHSLHSCQVWRNLVDRLGNPQLIRRSVTSASLSMTRQYSADENHLVKTFINCYSSNTEGSCAGRLPRFSREFERGKLLIMQINLAWDENTGSKFSQILFSSVGG